MNVLLIVVIITAVGKNHCQEAVVYKSQVNKLGRLPASNQKPVVKSVQISYQTPVPTLKLYTNAFRETEHNTQSSRSDNFNITPATVSETEPKQKLFISIKIPAKMSMNQPSDNDSAHSRANQKKDVHSEKDNLMNNDNLNFVTPPDITRQNITSANSTNASNEIPAVVDRSSFVGDQCPAGFVRVNGECVKKD